MKKLSIEEKAKAYDEAIKVLHKYDGANIMFSQSLKEEMFPELKEESEDDRIRKELLNYLYDVHDDDEERASWIAWLEKQAQKPADKVEPKFKVGDVIRLKGTAAEYTISRVTDTTYYTNGWSWDIERCEEDYELVEQQLTWSEEDERKMRYIENELSCLIADEREIESPLTERARDLYSVLYWFKSLKDRVQPQPKQEWSKEDNDKIYQILAIIDDYRRFYTIKPSLRKALLKDLDNIEAWLKSIRPQSQWKPSDEQMKALWEVYKGGEEQAALASLYSDLKKLKR